LGGKARSRVELFAASCSYLLVDFQGKRTTTTEIEKHSNLNKAVRDEKKSLAT